MPANDIVNKIAGFYLAFDGFDYDAVLSLFAEDGRWYRGDSCLEGKQAIHDFLMQRSKERLTAHIITNVHLEETQEGIQARYYITAYSNQSSQLIPSAVLLMTDVWVEDRAAGWLLKSKRAKTHLRL